MSSTVVPESLEMFLGAMQSRDQILGLMLWPYVAANERVDVLCTLKLFAKDILV